MVGSRKRNVHHPGLRSASNSSMIPESLPSQRREKARISASNWMLSAATTATLMILLSSTMDAFSVLPSLKTSTTSTSRSTWRRYIYAPPGSGYMGVEDEKSKLPDTYEPMMEYPGTMRPGRTPENVPFQDLPIQDSDPDPVPWPHFQQIEWHHQWEPPHEHPIPMEEFIELQGRWATPEMEAAMRAGVRQNVRERQELAEAEKRQMVITDDDDDDDDFKEQFTDEEEPVALGDGVFGKLGSDADRAMTSAATTAPTTKDGEAATDKDEDAEAGYDESDDGLDDFLLDLGLDLDLDDDDDETDEDEDAPKASSSKTATKTLKPSKTADEEEDEEDDDDDDDEITTRSSSSSNRGTTTQIDVVDDDDGDLDLGLDDDDDDSIVPLDDAFSGDDENDSLDTEDIFEDGGFDFDTDDYDGDGGDMW